MAVESTEVRFDSLAWLLLRKFLEVDTDVCRRAGISMQSMTITGPSPRRQPVIVKNASRNPIFVKTVKTV